MDKWASPAPLQWRDARGARCGAWRRCALIRTGPHLHGGSDPSSQSNALLSESIRVDWSHSLIGTGAPVRHSDGASASSPRLRARAPASGADACLPRALAGASTCQGCKRRAALLYKCTFCSSTVPTDCTITARQREIKWLCPDCIPALFSGQTRHFGSITSLLPVFPHYYHHYYLLDHHYYIHYYPVITSLLPIITVIMSPLLLIITSIIT